MTQAMNSTDHTGMADAYSANPPPSRTKRAAKGDWTQIVQRFVVDGVNLDDAWQWARDYAATSGIRAPSRDTLRDWILEAKRPKGLVRTYRAAKGPGKIQRLVPASAPTEIPNPAPTQMVEMGIGERIGPPTKPSLFLLMNAKGGSRRSHTAALVCNAMIEGGLAPIVGDFGNDGVLKALLPGIDILDLHLGRECDREQTYPKDESNRVQVDHAEHLKQLAEKAKFEERRLGNFVGEYIAYENEKVNCCLLDLPCNLNHSDLAMQVNVRDFRWLFHTVAIVPTSVDPATRLGAIRNMKNFFCDAWIHVKYGATKTDETTEIAEKSGAGLPVSVVHVPELSLANALALRRMPLLSNLAAYLAANPNELDRYLPFLFYWNAIRHQLIKAVALSFGNIAHSSESAVNTQAG